MYTIGHYRSNKKTTFLIGRWSFSKSWKMTPTFCYSTLLLRVLWKTYCKTHANVCSEKKDTKCSSVTLVRLVSFLFKIDVKRLTQISGHFELSNLKELSKQNINMKGVDQHQSFDVGWNFIDPHSLLIFTAGL